MGSAAAPQAAERKRLWHNETILENKIFEDGKNHPTLLISGSSSGISTALILPPTPRILPMASS